MKPCFPSVFKFPKIAATLVMLCFCCLQAWTQAQIHVLDEIVLPPDLNYTLKYFDGRYVGLATADKEGSLCGGISAWIEVDQQGEVLKMIPLHDKKGKSVYAHSFFLQDDKLYLLKAPTGLMVFDREGIFQKEIALKIPKGELVSIQYLGGELSSGSGASLQLATLGRYKYFKDHQDAINYGLTGPIFGSFDLHGNLMLNAGGRRPQSMIDHQWLSNFANATAGPDGTIICAFETHGELQIYRPDGKMIDSIPGKLLSYPVIDPTLEQSKKEFLYEIVTHDSWGAPIYHAGSNRLFRPFYSSLDTAICNPLLRQSDSRALLKLSGERGYELWVMDYASKIWTHRIQLPFPINGIMRIEDDEMWIKTGQKIVHVRMETSEG